MNPLVWLLVGVALGVVEMFTFTLVLGFFAAGALLAAGVGALGAPLLVQALVFVATSALLTVFVRPIAMRHRTSLPEERMNAEAVVDSPGRTLREISDTDGVVKVRGEEWTARPLFEGQRIPAGSKVTVARLDGATLYVIPTEGELNQ